MHLFGCGCHRKCRNAGHRAGVCGYKDRFSCCPRVKSTASETHGPNSPRPIYTGQTALPPPYGKTELPQDSTDEFAINGLRFARFSRRETCNSHTRTDGNCHRDFISRPLDGIRVRAATGPVGIHGWSGRSQPSRTGFRVVSSWRISSRMGDSGAACRRADTSTSRSNVRC